MKKHTIFRKRVLLLLPSILLAVPTLFVGSRNSNASVYASPQTYKVTLNNNTDNGWANSSSLNDYLEGCYREEGFEITLGYTAESRNTLVCYTVNDVPITGNKYIVPAHDIHISGVFAKMKSRCPDCRENDTWGCANCKKGYLYYYRVSSGECMEHGHVEISEKDFEISTVVKFCPDVGYDLDTVTIYDCSTCLPISVTADDLNDDYEYTLGAGNYVATATFAPAYDMSGVSFDNKSVTYNGSTQTIEITGTLPEGVTVDYYVNGDDKFNGYTEVGSYEVTAKFTGDAEHKPIKDMKATLNITKAVLPKPNDMSLLFANRSLDNDFRELLASNYYSISGNINNDYVNVGTVGYTLTIYDSAHYEFPNSQSTVQVVGNILPLDISGAVITFGTNGLVYNGNDQTATIASVVKDGVNVTSYEVKDSSNVRKDAGLYTVTIHGTNNFTGDATASFVIATAKVDKPTADNTEFVYNGQSQTYNIAANDAYTVSNNTQTNAGKYTVTVTLDSNYSWKDNGIDPVTFEFEIAKAVYDMSGISFEDKTYYYDGTEKSLAIEGNLPDGVTVSYENNGLTNIGEKNVTAKFTGNSNYEVISNKTATIKVKDNVVNSGSGQEVVADIDIPSAGDYTSTFNPDSDLSLAVELLAEKETIKNGDDVIDFNNLPKDVALDKEKVGAVYRVKLLETIGGTSTEIQPDDIKPGTKAKLKLKVPSEISEDTITRILCIDNEGKVESVKFDKAKLINGYYEIEASKLFAFAFVVENNALSIGMIILFACLGLLLIFIGLFLIWRRSFVKAVKNDNMDARKLKWLDPIYRPINKLFFGGKKAVENKGNENKN